MEFISDSIARCHVAESADADASSYDVGSPASIKKIPGEHLSGGCESLSDLRGITTLVTSGVMIQWSKVESFGCAELVLEDLATCEVDRVLCVGPSWRVDTSEQLTSYAALLAKFDAFLWFELFPIIGSKAFQFSTRLILNHNEPIIEDREHSIFLLIG